MCSHPIIMLLPNTQAYDNPCHLHEHAVTRSYLCQIHRYDANKLHCRCFVFLYFCSGKFMCVCSAPSFRSFPIVAFVTVPVLSDLWGTFLVLSRRIVKLFVFVCLSPLGSGWCDALGFVPAGSVSSSCTLQIFWDTSYLLCLPVCLLGRFPWL